MEIAKGKTVEYDIFRRMLAELCRDYVATPESNVQQVEAAQSLTAAAVKYLAEKGIVE